MFHNIRGVVDAMIFFENRVVTFLPHGCTLIAEPIQRRVAEINPESAIALDVSETTMNLTRHASVVTAIVVLYSGNALCQDVDGSAGVAAGTGYELIGTDRVSFGPGIQNESRKELLVKLSSNKGADAESSESDSAWSGGLAFDRIDFLKRGEIGMEDLADGLSYSARIEVTSVEDFNSQSEIVSSRQLGIHYGRLGPENYRSVDLGVRSISDEATDAGGELAEDKELWSLGVTTGRRFALTGLDSSDPLWTVSLRGQIDVTEGRNIDEALDNQQWYLSPGLHWNRDSFRLTADVLMPFMQSGEIEEDSDYRVRAKIQKRF